MDCELNPRLASERLDSGEVRLDKIVELIRASRLSIHDLSRVRATRAGELARLNMPFELGIDYGFAQADPAKFAQKRLLVIAEEPYKYQAALSDIAGWDIRSHGADYERAIREVRSWLGSCELTSTSSSRILGDYIGFQEWDYERLLASGWKESDIQERPTPELLRAMREWIGAGRPVTY